MQQNLDNFKNDKNEEKVDIQPGDVQTLNNADKKYIRFLYNMWNALKRPRIDLKEVGSIMDTYNGMQQEYRNEYLNVVFNPEKQANAKIPTLFPVPSSSFLSHQQVSVTTNPTGNIAFTWNPFYLQDNSSVTNSTFYVNNDSTLTGTNSNSNFKAVDIGYGLLPAGLYSQYRVVGASCVVTYTGRMDIVSGIIGIGIGLNNVGTAGVTTTPATDATSSLFGNFNLIDDLYFSKRTQAVNGCRAIYFPLDTRYLQFQQLGTSLQGFYFAFYGSGLPPSSQCLRIDFYIQYECTVQPIFNNYLTQSPGTYSNKNWLETTSEIIHKNPDVVTQTSSDIPSGTGTGGAAGVGSGWGDFMSGIFSALPSVAKSMVDATSILGSLKIPGFYQLMSGMNGLNNFIR